MPLLSQRGLLYVAGEDGLEAHAALLAEGEDLRELSARRGARDGAAAAPGMAARRRL